MEEQDDKGLGWKKDPEDDRDYLYKVDKVEELPAESKLYLQIPRWINQKHRNACTGYAVVNAIELFLNSRNRLNDKYRSPRDSYWKSRTYGGFNDEDGGAYLRDNFKAFSKLGICEHRLCVFSGRGDSDNVNDRPSTEAEINGIKTKVTYERITVSDLESKKYEVMKALSYYFPVVCGKTVTRSYVDFKGSDVLPAPFGYDPDVGGHATVYSGYSKLLDGSVALLEQGSWGSWGISSIDMPSGGWVSSDWLERCRDLWVITGVEDL